MWVLNESKTLELSKCVVSLVTIIIGISKPQLFHWQLGFVFEEAAILSPCGVIGVTVASAVNVCTCIIQAACAFVINRINSSPVLHLLSITWHPPAVHVTIGEELRVVALVLYKLLTVSWWSCQVCQLSHISLRVLDGARIRVFAAKPSHQRPAFTVMTDNCHSNTALVSHVTIDFERFHSALSIRIDDVISTREIT